MHGDNLHGNKLKKNFQHEDLTPPHLWWPVTWVSPHNPPLIGWGIIHSYAAAKVTQLVVAFIKISFAVTTRALKKPHHHKQRTLMSQLLSKRTEESVMSPKRPAAIRKNNSFCLLSNIEFRHVASMPMTFSSILCFVHKPTIIKEAIVPLRFRQATIDSTHPK
jgi:hypothetical protein